MQQKTQPADFVYEMRSATMTPKNFWQKSHKTITLTYRTFIRRRPISLQCGHVRQAHTHDTNVWNTFSTALSSNAAHVHWIQLT